MKKNYTGSKRNEPAYIKNTTGTMLVSGTNRQKLLQLTQPTGNRNRETRKSGN